MELIDKYNIYIRDSYDDLIFSGKKIDNYDLDKIFEYYSCIQLSKKYKKQFYEYNDIDPTFKEQNKMTRNDTGIDACNLIDTIVQCKLRKDSLRWEDCGTFFGSQNIFDSVLKKTIVKWDNLIITRNKECKLSKNLKERKELFTDITYSRDEIIDYCNNLITNPPKIKKIKDEDFKLRDYQLESIEIINKNKNVIISLPTGCGKNVVIIFSINEKKRYLILVPRIILMEQIKTEIIKHRPELENKIQTIGDNNNEYDKTKNITICVYNSVSVIEKYGKSFDKIYIDEAHHINIPEIYEVEQIEDDNETIEENDNIINDDESNVSDEEYYSVEDKESILKDDTEDEIKNTTGYNKIIKSLSKYNNNVYLSATIDEIKDFTYYKKDIRDMIDNKYLCDYTIHIPIFSDDPSNKNICEHLLRNYRNIIIYCNSQKEGKKINELLNTLQKGCSEYIDCKTSRNKRDEIIKSYKDGEIPFLVNVRILVEGFDAPITKGVCFIHLPSSKTTIIQIIGRALRLHSLKTYANIILPFSSKDDETNINKFLKILAQNDKRIKKSYESKTEGGYISIEKIKDKKDDKENKNIEFRYNMIYNSMGVLQNREEIWENKLIKLKKYIDENNNKCPSRKIEIGKWLKRQKEHYKSRSRIMSHNNIRLKWEKFINDDKYKIHFLSNNEKWLNNLKKVKDYINKEEKRPSESSKIKEISSIGGWVNTQITNYKSKNDIMAKNEIRILWDEFINEYKDVFLSTNERWDKNLNEVIKYMNENKNKLPSSESKDTDIKYLGNWILEQKKSYKKNKMSENKNKWENFINDEKYKTKFLLNAEEWENKLIKLKKYMNENNNKRPSTHDIDEDIRGIATWIQTQLQNYKNKQFIMSNDDIYNKWTEFINNDKYKEEFLSNAEKWLDNLKKVKDYINKENKRPSEASKIEDISFLGGWISSQQNKYKSNTQIMKDIEIKKKWEEFITEYQQYFPDNPAII